MYGAVEWIAEHVGRRERDGCGGTEAGVGNNAGKHIREGVRSAGMPEPTDIGWLRENWM